MYWQLKKLQASVVHGFESSQSLTNKQNKGGFSQVPLLQVCPGVQLFSHNPQCSVFVWMLVSHPVPLSVMQFCIGFEQVRQFSVSQYSEYWVHCESLVQLGIVGVQVPFWQVPPVQGVPFAIGLLLHVPKSQLSTVHGFESSHCVFDVQSPVG